VQDAKPISAAAKRFPKKTPLTEANKSPTELIDARIGKLQHWRGVLLARLRAVIAGADPSIIEEWKWNTAAWSSNGIICTGEAYR
jgi:hypothetical protein